jgi:hypothetical protein
LSTWTHRTNQLDRLALNYVCEKPCVQSIVCVSGLATAEKFIQILDISRESATM